MRLVCYNVTMNENQLRIDFLKDPSSESVGGVVEAPESDFEADPSLYKTDEEYKKIHLKGALKDAGRSHHLYEEAFSQEGVDDKKFHRLSNRAENMRTQAKLTMAHVCMNLCKIDCPASGMDLIFTNDEYRKYMENYIAKSEGDFDCRVAIREILSMSKAEIEEKNREYYEKEGQKAIEQSAKIEQEAHELQTRIKNRLDQEQRDFDAGKEISSGGKRYKDSASARANDPLDE